MYVNFTYSFILLPLFFVSQFYGQGVQGKAFYASKTSVEINLDNRNIPQQRKEIIKQRMKSSLEKEFELTFDSTSSLYKELERLDTPRSKGFIVKAHIYRGDSSGLLFKDLAKQTYTRKRELFGKLFLIQDSLYKRNWQLGAESKKIGQYTCYKATYTRKVKNRSTSWKRSDQNEKSTESVAPRSVIVTAWYTMDIPVSSGPNLYGGLPGLILEISDDNTTILCTKVVLNPKDKIAIKAPQKGKKVSQNEFNTIRANKAKEMREQFQNGKGRNSGNRTKIRG